MRRYDEDYLKQLGKMQRPVPGMSLTNNPDQPHPFEGPPEFTKKKDAVEYIFDRLIDEEVYPKMIEATANGTPVMETTQMLLFSGFTEGKWNPDLLMMLAEPTAYMIMGLSERAGVDYRIDREPDPEDQEQEEMSQLDMQLKKVKAKISKSDFTDKDIPVEVRKELESTPLPSLVEKPQAPEQPEEADLPAAPEAAAPQEAPVDTMVPRRGV